MVNEAAVPSPTVAIELRARDWLAGDSTELLVQPIAETTNPDVVIGVNCYCSCASSNNSGVIDNAIIFRRGDADLWRALLGDATAARRVDPRADADVLDADVVCGD